MKSQQGNSITAKNVAELAGVSISTVGRALANDPRISRDTSAKIKKAAERLGYVGNMPARIMRGGTSNLLGLLIPDISNHFYSSIAQALSNTCDQEGFRLVLSITGDDRDVEARHIRELAGARAAGIIIVPTAKPRRESIKMLKSMPHVQLLRQIPNLGGGWFGMDDKSALRDATAHLIKLGHRRIAYIGGPETLSTGTSRVSGFRTAFADAGVSTSTAIEILGNPIQECGFSAMEKLAKSKNPPTAVLTGSSQITLGVIEAVEHLKISVPKNMSLIGFGDPQWFSWWKGGLTTVKPPIQELATSCALWLLHRLRTGDEPSIKENHTATTHSTLIIRSTTTAPSPASNRK